MRESVRVGRERAVTPRFTSLEGLKDILGGTIDPQFDRIKTAVNVDGFNVPATIILDPDAPHGIKLDCGRTHRRPAAESAICKRLGLPAPKPANDNAPRSSTPPS